VFRHVSSHRDRELYARGIGGVGPIQFDRFGLHPVCEFMTWNFAVRSGLDSPNTGLLISS
jgi:hypothetical protein